jgi:hypothetical protein
MEFSAIENAAFYYLLPTVKCRCFKSNLPISYPVFNLPPGNGDQVRCFSCDGGLKYWDPDDEPWTEHAKWFDLVKMVLYWTIVFRQFTQCLPHIRKLRSRTHTQALQIFWGKEHLVKIG